LFLLFLDQGHSRLIFLEKFVDFIVRQLLIRFVAQVDGERILLTKCQSQM